MSRLQKVFGSSLMAVHNDTKHLTVVWLYIAIAMEAFCQ